MNENNNNNLSEAVNDVVSGVEQAPKKKKGGKIAAAGVGAVVLLGGGGAVAYNCSDFVKNKVKLATLEPEEYYAWVVENTAEESSESISKYYQEFLDRYEKGISSNFAVEYEASDAVKELLLQEMDADSAPEEAKSVIDAVNNIKTIKIGAVENVKKGASGSELFLNVNDEKLVSAQVAANADLASFLSIPELNDKWLGISIDDTMATLDSNEAAAEFSGIMDSIKGIYADPESFLAADEIEKLVKTYTGVWTETLSDTELEKGETVEIGDISADYTVITTELDGDALYDLADAYVEKLSDDDLIKEIVTERLGVCDGDEYDALFDEAKESLDKDAFADMESVDFVTYVDSKGHIQGVGLEAEDGEMTFVAGEDGDKSCAEFEFSDGASTNVSCVINAEKDGKKTSGEAEFTVTEEDEEDDVEFSVEFEDIEVVNEDYGFFNGKITAVIPGITPIALDCSSDGKTQEMSTSIEVAGTDYGKITLSFGEGDYDDSIKADEANAIMIGDDFDIESYTNEEEVSALISDICKKLGVDEDMSKQLGELASSSIFESGYDYDDDDYDYDFDDDDDDYDDDDYGYDFDDEEDPYEADIVEAQNGDAFVYVMDEYYRAIYYGYGGSGCPLAYNAKNAAVTKDGTYTVSVTADTDGYRYATTGDEKDDSEKPSNFSELGVEIYNVEVTDALNIKIDSLKIDGKEVKLSGEPKVEEDYGDAAVMLYDYYDDELQFIDGENIGEWTTIEITFTVKGIGAADGEDADESDADKDEESSEPAEESKKAE